MGGSKASKDSLLEVNKCPETCCVYVVNNEDSLDEN